MNAMKRKYMERIENTDFTDAAETSDLVTDLFYDLVSMAAEYEATREEAK